MEPEDEPIYAEPAGTDDEWSQDGGPGHGAWPGRQGDGGVPGFSVRRAAVVAMVAATVGVTAGLLLVRGTPIADGARQAAAPSASATSGPAAGGAGLPALPALAGQGDGQLQLMLTGRVLAISRTSITMGGNGPSVTAAITRSTKITGAVHGIDGVKAGDEVSAQVTGTSRHLTATAIQDPAVT